MYLVTKFELEIYCFYLDFVGKRSEWADMKKSISLAAKHPLTKHSDIVALTLAEKFYHPKEHFSKGVFHINMHMCITF